MFPPGHAIIDTDAFPTPPSRFNHSRLGFECKAGMCPSVPLLQNFLILEQQLDQSSTSRPTDSTSLQTFLLRARFNFSGCACTANLPQ